MICSEVFPRDGDTVLYRKTFGGFAGNNLNHYLKAKGIEAVLLAGMMANHTVAMTAREAADRGYHAVIVQDACASETLECHLLAMNTLVGGLIRVRSTREVIDMLSYYRR